MGNGCIPDHRVKVTPAVKVELHGQQDALFAGATHDAAASMGEALDTLRTIMTDANIGPSARVAAARALLKRDGTERRTLPPGGMGAAPFGDLDHGPAVLRSVPFRAMMG